MFCVLNDLCKATKCKFSFRRKLGLCRLTSQSIAVLNYDFDYVFCSTGRRNTSFKAPLTLRKKKLFSPVNFLQRMPPPLPQVALPTYSRRIKLLQTFLKLLTSSCKFWQLSETSTCNILFLFYFAFVISRAVWVDSCVEDHLPFTSNLKILSDF